MERMPSPRRKSEEAPIVRSRLSSDARNALRAVLVGYGLITSIPLPESSQEPQQSVFKGESYPGRQILNKEMIATETYSNIERNIRRPSVDSFPPIVSERSSMGVNGKQEFVQFPMVEPQATRRVFDSADAVVDTVLRDREFDHYDPQKIVGEFHHLKEARHARELLWTASQILLRQQSSDLAADTLAIDQLNLAPEQFHQLLDWVSPKASVETALLAFNLEPDQATDPHAPPSVEASIDMDSAVRHVGDVPLGLVGPLVYHSVDPATAESYLRETFSIQDPGRAASRAALMAHVSAKYDNLNPIELEQSRAFVGRNLGWKGLDKKPTVQQVKDEVDSIRKRRTEIGPDRPLADDVILVSNGERAANDRGAFKKGDARFGTPAFVAGIQQIQREYPRKTPPHFQHIAPLSQDSGGATTESVAQAREQALEHVRDGSHSVTMVFDGHGSLDGFYIDNGTVKADGTVEGLDKGKISVSNMVSALAKRWTIQHKAHPHDKELNISLIFTSCFSQNYVRSIAEELGKQQIPLPRLMISGTEYGQYGWTTWESSYGMQFNELLISFPTLGEILQNKRFATHSTPSIFVPRKEDPKKLMQLGGIVVPQPTTEVG